MVLGEGLIASLLLASTSTSGEHVCLSLKPAADNPSPIRQLVADAEPECTVRGFIIKQTGDGARLAETHDGKAEGGRWIDGLLSVVRLKEYEKEPYTGAVPALTGHISKDLTFYLSQSEQTPSAVGIAVSHDGKRVDFAGVWCKSGWRVAEEVALVKSTSIR